jgi:hypothetical protein
MKKLLFALTSLILLVACVNPTKQHTKISSKKIIGTYNVDISPMFKHLKSDSNESGLAQLGKGFALLMLNSIDIAIKFDEDNKGFIQIAGGDIDLDGMVNGTKLTDDNAFNYSIKNDSLLMIKSLDDKEYENWAIIKKVHGNYSSLQLQFVSDDLNNVTLNLDKIQENK